MAVVDYSQSKHYQAITDFLIQNPEFAEWMHKYPIPVNPAGSQNETTQFNLLKHLVYTIIAQAISWQHLGAKIFAAMQKRIPGNDWKPSDILNISDDEFKAMSFSTAKIQYCRAIAQFLDVRIDKTEKQILEDLLNPAIRPPGIGPFTIKYYQYCRGAPNVALYEDICVRKGMQIIYGTKLTIQDCKKLCAKWGDNSSIGTSICYAVNHYNLK